MHITNDETLTIVSALKIAINLSKEVGTDDQKNMIKIALDIIQHKPFDPLFTERSEP